VKRWISQGEDSESESEPEEEGRRQGDLNVAEGVEGNEEKHAVKWWYTYRLLDLSTGEVVDGKF
jgi:hypothetical protein